MKSTKILELLSGVVSESQIVADEHMLYDAAADRYKKYAKVMKCLDVPLPLAIVYPKDTDQVKRVLMMCNEQGINVIPRSGKTATEGGLENWKEESIVVDGSKMNNIINVDYYNMQVTVQCGTKLQDLEDELRKKGYTTGHSPQSKPVAQYGGLVATRSIGQFSTLYGAIEDMIVGLECVFPDGHIARIKNIPRRSGGPDIRHIVVGNEGALCYITELSLKIFKYYPENNIFHGYLVKDIAKGTKILREVITEGFRPSVARLYSEQDAGQHFDFHEDKCVLIFMCEGPKGIVDATSESIKRAVEKFKEYVIKEVSPEKIENWFNHLNWTQENIDNEIKDMKSSGIHGGFTTEISANWEEIPKIYDDVMARIKKEFKFYDELTLLGGHSSHSYINGTNMYFVYNYKINCKPEDEMRLYHHPIHSIIIEETLKHGGSMCHHHGIGKYRTEWIKEEHGSAYYLLEKLKQVFDPKGIMNYGTIYPQDEAIKKYIRK